MAGYEQLCEELGAEFDRRGIHLAVAESLTGGLLTNAFAKASGASEWFCGGVVAYQRNPKHNLLDVPDGPVVSEASAVAMARGATRVLAGDVGLAVTGAGGPDPQDGQPPGTVWIAVVTSDATTTRQYAFDGDPPTVIDHAVTAAVQLLDNHVRQVLPQ